MHRSTPNPSTSRVPLSFRQGDVLLVEVDQIPDDARAEPRSGRIVLAEGEATGQPTPSTSAMRAPSRMAASASC